MSTLVCQDLQSCLESQFVETTTLKLKLATSRGSCFFDCDTKEVIKEKCNSDDMSKKIISSNLELPSLSFLQTLSNSQNPNEEILDNQSSYVHPSSKQSSSSRLSDISLELCTENLGNETGTDVMENSIFSFDSWSERSPPKQRQVMESRKVSSHNFPPPLTTIRGSNSLHVRPHREGGRLIIEAVESPPIHTYLQAERSHGRLRLCLLKNCATNIDSIVTTLENDARGEDEIDEYESDINDEEDEEEKSEDEENYDMNCNSFDVEMEKFKRRSWCNEGLCNWEGLCVATS